jgi:Flp pilus assembly protein TadG
MVTWFNTLATFFNRLFDIAASANCQPQLSRAYSRVPALVRDRRGGTTILVSIGAPAIIGGLALSMDVGLWYLEKRKLQQISDTASLGAVSVLRSGGSQPTARSVALNDARRNGFVADSQSDLVVNIPPTKGPYAGDANAVEVVVTKRLPLLFSGFFLSDDKIITARSVAIHSSATAAVPRRNLEVALILDVSTSMAGASDIPGMTKLQAVQDGAKKVVDVIVQSNQEPYSTRVSIVPYGSAVSVGDAYFNLVTNTAPMPQAKAGVSDVIERTGTAAFTDDAPGPGKYFPGYTGNTKQLVKLTASNESMRRQTSVISPLSADKSQLHASIDSFKTGGKTAGHIGLAWAWNTLSPKWGQIWSGNSVPTAYDADKTLKVAVLLSDFDLTVTYTDLNGPASDQAMQLCTRMKQAGITIYTVAYNMPAGNLTAARLWQGCASGTDKAYTAANASALIDTFATIAHATADSVRNAGPQLAE